MGNTLARRRSRQIESNTHENSSMQSSVVPFGQREKQITPRRHKKCKLKNLVHSPFDESIRRNKFSHMIFQEHAFDKLIQEGLVKLNLDDHHDGENFNIPPFLRKYANDLRGMKIKLNFVSSPVPEKTLKAYPESSYLITNMKYLKMWYLGHPLKKGSPIVIIHENHGNIRRKFLRKSKNREMFVRINVTRGKHYAIYVGKDFMLTLAPPDRESLTSDFHDSNGRKPLAVGFYTRMLDTNPRIILEWNALLYDWYNETPGPPYMVEELLDVKPPNLLKYFG